MSDPTGIRIHGKDRHIFTQNRRMPQILIYMDPTKLFRKFPQEKFPKLAYSLTNPAICTIQPIKSTSHFFNGGIWLEVMQKVHTFNYKEYLYV